MRTNYVLIDYENVQPAPEALALLDIESFKALVFVGASQTKLSFDAVQAVQRLGAKAQYIRISGNGPNALDFHVAFYIGQFAAVDPDGYFHIVSRDKKGFDPLIEHLKIRKILAARHNDVTEIQLVKAANSKLPAEKIDAIVADLNKRGVSRPRAVKTLTSTIHALFQKKLGEEEVNALLAELQERKLITINGTKVSYDLSA